MFDWSEEELTNIIWGDNDESDNHIVPYPESSNDYCKKKKWSQEAGNDKYSEEKLITTKVDVNGKKPESGSCEGTSASGFDMDSWPNPSLSNTGKTDHDSLDTSVSNNLTEITKLDSSGDGGAETIQLDKDSEIFQDLPQGKEQGDFVNYGWNGSFDDLDQIFSNDDPIFGNVSLGNADELWPSSKDVTNRPVKPFPISMDCPSLGLETLSNASHHFGIKIECVQDNYRSFSLGYDNMNDPVSRGLHNAHIIFNPVEYTGGKNKCVVREQTGLTTRGKTTSSNSQVTAGNVALPNELTNKVYKQKKLLKSQKKFNEKSDVKLCQDSHGNWSSLGHPSVQVKNQFSPPIARSTPPAVLGQQRQLHGYESLQYQHISNPFMVSSAYGGIANPYSAMPALSHIQSGEFKNQNFVSGFEVSSSMENPGKKLANTSGKAQTMTPQEKIEKLRRRQQMQALLAIQKQRQQFGPNASSSYQSIAQAFSQENQIQHVEGADLEAEDLSTLPSFDPNSPIEQDDASTISAAFNDYSTEKTILYRLQDIVGKLDVRIRLCVRDSLFRLAQSAIQRHYVSDTSSTNSRDEQSVPREEARNSKMMETETNPIDRTVAHLLFHRPLELLGQHPDTPESLASTKISSENKTVGISKLSIDFSKTPKNKQKLVQQSENSSQLANPQSVSLCKSSLCLDTPENASNNAPPVDDEGAREVEASQ